MRILSIDGGGYLGLAAVAFLEECERHFGDTCHRRFDFFCGTSAGAIISLALSKGLTAKEVSASFQELGPRVFSNPFPGCRLLRTIGRGLFSSRYGNAELKTCLGDIFGEVRFRDVLAKGKHLLVPAFSVTQGKPRIFKTDHAAGLTRDSDLFLRDVALASSAAPVFLPIVKLNDAQSGDEERFADGGVFSNNPALLAYAEAIFHLNVPSEDIEILSVSTPRADLSEFSAPLGRFAQFRLSRGLFSWGLRLSSVFIDSTTGIHHETLRRLMNPSMLRGNRYSRIVLHKPKGIEMDIATPYSTNALRQLGLDKGRDGEVRQQVRHFFKEGEH